MGWSFLSDEDEEQIATCIRDFQAAGFPLTMPRVRSLAWQYADLALVRMTKRLAVGGG